VKEQEAREQPRTLEERLDALSERVPPSVLEEIRAIVRAADRRVERQRDLSGRLQQTIEARVAALERSPVFRTLRWWDRTRRGLRVRGGQWLLTSPLHPLYLQLFPPPTSDPEYEQYLTAGLDHRFGHPRFNRPAPPLEGDLSFSILLPCCDPRREWLEAAVDSVKKQEYPNWELAIVDDASREPWVKQYLEELSASDRRIRNASLSERRGISGALNEAGRLSRGGYIGVLDHDDLLAPTALASYAEALRVGRADLLYSDEDRLNEQGNFVEPILKPGWSPELLQECMYLCHFLMVSRESIDQAGWFRSECDGAQDYDLVLRIASQDPVVCHVPRVLYHWRKHRTSTSSDTSAKPWTHDAGRRALEDAARERGWPNPVQDGPRHNVYRVPWGAEPPPPVTIVICSRDAGLLQRALDGIREKTTYPAWRVIVVRHLPDEGGVVEAAINQFGAVRVDYDGEFNFAHMSNLGASKAADGVLVFLNDDVVPLEPDWLTVLVAQVVRPTIAVAGARLLYPFGAVQHVGMAVGMMDGAGHPHRGCASGRYWNWLDVRREVTAVTGACMAIRREVFEELGGFDEAFPTNYNDVDLCLRARQLGYSIVYEPRATLRHDECGTRLGGTNWQERELFHERWMELIDDGDPFYNPNLALGREDCSLRDADEG